MARRLSTRHFELLAHAGGELELAPATAADSEFLAELQDRGLLIETGPGASRLTVAGREYLRRHWNRIIRSKRKRKRGNPLNARLPGSFGTGRR